MNNNQHNYEQNIPPYTLPNEENIKKEISFGASFVRLFKLAFNYKDKDTRREFWFGAIWMLIVSVVILGIFIISYSFILAFQIFEAKTSDAQAISGNSFTVFTTISVFLSIILLFPIYASIHRRMLDAGFAPTLIRATLIIYIVCNIYAGIISIISTNEISQDIINILNSDITNNAEAIKRFETLSNLSTKAQTQNNIYQSILSMATFASFTLLLIGCIMPSKTIKNTEKLS